MSSPSPSSIPNYYHLVIIGAGAAGFAAAIFAAEAAQGHGLRIVLLDGARKPGAKILVSGGGRCNVTNETVTPEDYWGGPRGSVKKVLKAFDNARTLAWMKSLGVALKLEPTGKYFPVTDSARTVLDALLRRAEDLDVEFRFAHRVTTLQPGPAGEWELAFRDAATPPLRARRVILATGGLSLPKSGSDGWGLDAARRLGHSIIPTTPALVPLVTQRDGEGMGRGLADLSGLTVDARLALLDSAGRTLETRTGSVLLTHFGLSGPAVLDLSRHWLRRRLEGDAACTVTLGHPRFPHPQGAEEWLLRQAQAHPRRLLSNALREVYPERLADLVVQGRDTQLAQLPKDHRRAVARDLAQATLPVTGDRGWSYAETTAGGVDLREVRTETMESRLQPGLHLCGEMLDVDGRIGGFNFQWAWASGYLAGRGAVVGLNGSHTHHAGG